MNYDFVIIGSGISGLNLCNNLYKNNKILLLEKNDNIGGRIQTIKDNKIVFEAGAARFNNYHKNLLNLIKLLKLDKNLIKIDNKTVYKSYPKNLNKDLVNKFKNIDEIIKLLIKKTKHLSKNELQKYTIKTLLFKYLEKENKGLTKHFENIFNYYSEFAHMNAYNSLELFKKEFNSNIEYFLLNNGLSEITNKLFNKFKNKIDYKFNYIVNKIELVNDNYLINEKIKCKNIILAINKISLKQIKLINFNKNLLNNFIKNYNSIVCKSLYRLYFKYSNNDIWFSNIQKTTTNLDIKFIIPYDIKNGLIMISYTDGKYAENMLSKRMNLSEEEFINYIHKQINKLYPNVKLNKPEKIYDHYWNCAAGYWKINKNSDLIYKNLLNPFNRIYLCNENFSKKQAWIEGSLEMSNDVLNIINKQTINNVIDKKKGGNANKKYKLDEIKKHNKSSDLWGYYDNKVYDLTKFIEYHPGGKSILSLINYDHNIKKTWEEKASWHIKKNHDKKLDKIKYIVFKGLKI